MKYIIQFILIFSLSANCVFCQNTERNRLTGELENEITKLIQSNGCDPLICYYLTIYLYLSNNALTNSLKNLTRNKDLFKPRNLKNARIIYECDCGNTTSLRPPPGGIFRTFSKNYSQFNKKTLKEFSELASKNTAEWDSIIASSPNLKKWTKNPENQKLLSDIKIEIEAQEKESEDYSQLEKKLTISQQEYDNLQKKLENLQKDHNDLINKFQEINNAMKAPPQNNK